MKRRPLLIPLESPFQDKISKFQTLEKLTAALRRHLVSFNQASFCLRPAAMHPVSLFFISFSSFHSQIPFPNNVKKILHVSSGRRLWTIPNRHRTVAQPGLHVHVLPRLPQERLAPGEYLEPLHRDRGRPGGHHLHRERPRRHVQRALRSLRVSHHRQWHRGHRDGVQQGHLGVWAVQGGGQHGLLCRGILCVQARSSQQHWSGLRHLWVATRRIFLNYVWNIAAICVSVAWSDFTARPLPLKTIFLKYFGDPSLSVYNIFFISMSGFTTATAAGGWPIISFKWPACLKMRKFRFFVHI